jgi:hypothetical protein
MAENGRIPTVELTRIYHPTYKVYLEDDAAAAFNTLRIWSVRYLKTDLYPTGENSAYRTYEMQEYFWNEYLAGRGNLAAEPGTSNHGWGLAVDLAATWMLKIFGKRIASALGWKKTEAFSEWWHFNYVGGFRRPNPGINSKYPIARIGSGGFGQKWFVKKLERRLKRLGYKWVKVDGEFGPATRKAVRDFQSKKGLSVDGVVGRKTWIALEAAKPKWYKKFLLKK